MDATAIIGIRESGYYLLSGSVMYIYHCILTFDEEVNYFWTGKTTGATVIFFLNRYLIMFSQAYSLALIPPHFYAPKTCTTVQWVSNITDILINVPWAAFSGLRAFALSQVYVVSILVFLLSMLPAVLSSVLLTFNFQGINLPLVGCLSYGDQSPKLENIGQQVQLVAVTSATSTVLAEALLVFTTWHRLLRHNRQPKKKSFAYVLLLDGAVYFLILLVIDILQLLDIVIPGSSASYQNLTNIIVFSQPLTAIVVSRFMLDLQAAKHAGSDHDSALSQQPHSDVVFGRIIGSLNASLTVFSGDIDPPLDEQSINRGEGFAVNSPLGTTPSECVEDGARRSGTVYATD